MSPIAFFATASGLMMDRVRSRAMRCLRKPGNGRPAIPEAAHLAPRRRRESYAYVAPDAPGSVQARRRRDHRLDDAIEGVIDVGLRREATEENRSMPGPARRPDRCPGARRRARRRPNCRRIEACDVRRQRHEQRRPRPRGDIDDAGDARIRVPFRWMSGRLETPSRNRSAVP